MLKQRVLTACLLIPLTLLLIFYASPSVFIVVTALILLAAAWEWSRLMTLTSVFYRILYLFSVFMLMFAVPYLPLLFETAFIWWCVAFCLVLIYPRASYFWGRGIFWRGLMGWLVIIPAWAAINFIRIKMGSWTLLYLLVMIWLADSAAYFAGRRFGKHYLAPAVSPKKSWEGLIGALIAVILYTIVVLKFTEQPTKLWQLGIIFSVITIIFSVVGDLLESMVKRKAGVKDSGNILPGHGGLLDRIDSITAAAPVYAMLSIWLSKG